MSLMYGKVFRLLFNKKESLIYLLHGFVTLFSKACENQWPDCKINVSVC